MNKDISSNPDGLALQPAVPPEPARPAWRRRGAVLGAATVVGLLVAAGPVLALQGLGGDRLRADTVSVPAPTPTPTAAVSPSPLPPVPSLSAAATSLVPPAPPLATSAPLPTSVTSPKAVSSPVRTAAAVQSIAPSRSPSPTATPAAVRSSPATTPAGPEGSTVHLVNGSKLDLLFTMSFSEHDRTDPNRPTYDRTERWRVPAGGRLTVVVRNPGMGVALRAAWVDNPECAWDDGDGSGPKPGTASTVTVVHAGDVPEARCGGRAELSGTFSPYQNWQ